ncbi:DUF6122 family protein [uncultured Marivirga sp.]|uniref:DUF6122 family protein n=1 Tax=uncultured Marivirga sp. TaxID=1123707 RepID=UPI0030EF312C|tara:strand:- start:24443 stop:24760 length:318 start_codon:yes stop_codon:yes gene_type:complete
MIFTLIHYSLHFIAPLAIAYLYSPKKWKRAYLILIGTMLVDLDHLLASPIFDPERCSIGFHPLHSYFAILIYLFLLFPKISRLVAIGLLFHMFTDGLDCILQGTF